MKQLPFPGLLSRVISPPSSRTSRSTIESPSPNPSTPRAELLRSNSRKMRSRSPAPMPRPVSRTEKRSRPPPQATSSSTPPVSVNFTAFESRKSATWRMREASPVTSQRQPSPVRSVSVSPLAAACAAKPARMASKRRSGMKGTVLSSILWMSSR